MYIVNVFSIPPPPPPPINSPPLTLLALHKIYV